jgi:hypothetical protein
MLQLHAKRNTESFWIDLFRSTLILCDSLMCVKYIFDV